MQGTNYEIKEISPAESASVKYRQRRKQLRFGQKTKQKEKSYQSGAFGLGIQPENVLIPPKKKKVPRKTTLNDNASQSIAVENRTEPLNTDIEITFVDDIEMDVIVSI